jgi:hypothetical protein
MPFEPLPGQSGHFLKRSRLLKEVCCSRNYFQFLVRLDLLHCPAVHIDYRSVLPAYNQQCRGLDAGQGWLGKVGRPPRDTTAATSLGRSAAATRAAAAPVLAPK